MKKWLASLLISLLCLTSLSSTQVFAFGGGHSFGGGRGFSGGHSSFSGGGSRVFGHGFSLFGGSQSGGRSLFGSFSNKSSNSYSTPRTDVSKSSVSKSYSSGAGVSSGKNYSSGSGSFSGSGSRTISGTGPSSGARSVYGTGYRGYSLSGSPYYNRRPVGIWGYAPRPPLFYHNWYWGMPFYMHWLFTPTYYGGFGYHYFLPNFTSLFFILAIIFIMFALMRRRY